MRTRYAWGTLGVILLVMWLTLPQINTSLWTDEERTLWYAGASPQYGPVPLSENIARVAENLWQSPGYFMVMAGWGRVFGWAEFPMRMFSLYVGLLALAAMYQLGRCLFSVEVGFYATFTLGMSAFIINFLHDMRTYSLNVLLAALMLWAYVRFTRGRSSGSSLRNDIAWYVTLTLAAAGLLYTHYFNAFGVAALGLWHVIFHFRKQRYWAILACFIAAGVLFLPWVGVLLDGMALASVDKRIIANLPALQAINQLLNGFSNEARALMIVLFVLALRPFKANQRFVAFWLIVSFALTVIATRIVPAFTEIKYVIYLFPALALIAGLGIANMRQFGLHPAVIVVLWGALAVWNLYDADAQARIQARDWQVPLKELMDLLDNRTLPEDVVIFHLAEGAEEANRNEMMDFYMHPFDIINGELIPANDATPDDLYYQRVRDAVQRADRVWLSYEVGRRSWRVGPTEEMVLPDEGYVACGVAEQTEKVYLSLFAHEPNRDQGLAFVTSEDEEIDLFVLAPPRLTDDNRLEVNIGWHVVDEITPGLHSFAVQIEDTDGNFITSVDYGIPTNDFGCVIDMIPVPDVLSGEYLVKATVYNWQTGERLSSVTDTEDERLIIGTIMIP